MDFLYSYIQETQIKVAGISFILTHVLVIGVSELNILVFQNNCLLYAWISKDYFMSHRVEIQSVVYYNVKIHQTDDTTKYMSTHIF